MNDNLRALIEAELILQRLAAEKPPETDQPMQVRVITPDDPDYGREYDEDENGQRIMRVTVKFDKPGTSGLEADED